MFVSTSSSIETPANWQIAVNRKFRDIRKERSKDLPVFEVKRVVAILCVITMDSDYSRWAACIQLKRNNIGSQGISDFWFAIISSKLP